MNPPPTAVGLFACQQVIVDKDTHNPSCVGIFTKFFVNEFPSSPRPFTIFASLTDALGNGIMKIAITELASGSEVYSDQWAIAFTDRLDVVNIKVHLGQVSFPFAGRYSLAVLVDEELIADRILNVLQR